MCKNGIHELEVIYREWKSDSECVIVRWCNKCGAIVIDGEYDGRTAPGKYMKMKLPEVAIKLGVGN